MKLRAAYFLTTLTKHLRIPTELSHPCPALKIKTSASVSLTGVYVVLSRGDNNKTRIIQRHILLISHYLNVLYLS